MVDDPDGLRALEAQQARLVGFARASDQGVSGGGQARREDQPVPGRGGAVLDGGAGEIWRRIAAKRNIAERGTHTCYRACKGVRQSAANG